MLLLLLSLCCGGLAADRDCGAAVAATAKTAVVPWTAVGAAEAHGTASVATAALAATRVRI